MDIRPKEAHFSGRTMYTSAVFFIFDYLSIVIAGFLAVAVRNSIMTYNHFRVNPIYLLFWLPVVFLLFIFFKGLYGRRIIVYQMTERLLLACLGGTVFSVLLMFLTQVSGQVSRLFVVLFTLFAFLLLSITRLITCRIIRNIRAFQIPILIVGAGKTADIIVRQLMEDSGMRYRIIGFLEDRKPYRTYEKDLPILGGFNDLEDVVKETGVNSVLIAAPGLSQNKLSDMIYRAQSLVKNVAVVPNLVAVPMSNITVESFFDAKIMVLNIRNNLDNRWNRILKRTFDLTATVIGGLLISPILLAIALWVYHDSPGPVIYKNKRVGLNGKTFYCYKFRSMYMNNKEILNKYLLQHPDLQEEWNTYRKLRGKDPRITPVGKILRKYSIDELPQLLNVLKGEMSLVGPRPYLSEEIPMMGKESNIILMAKPGITGYWQISGRNDVTFKERVNMESWYVYNWRLWMDIVLLWRTIAVVVHHKGAY